MPDFKDTNDFLNTSTILRSVGVNRVHFDPADQDHLASFRQFLRTGNWGDIQFYCEAPFTDVPMTVLMKYAMYDQGVRRESERERQIRVAHMNLLIAPLRENAVI